jgi:aminopeptidase 2
MSPEILAINEYHRVLQSLTKHAAGKEALWKWLKANMEDIQRKIGGGLGRFTRMVELCTAHLSTKAQWEDVRGFFEGKDTEVSEDDGCVNEADK